MESKTIRLYTLPNLVTLLNLGAGCAAAVMALRYGDLKCAFWLVVAAAVFDFLDGFTARLTGQYSEVGKQLDSLADMVSFGFVPAAVLFTIHQSAGGTAGSGYFIFILTLFSALRLAKFNVDQSQGDSFVGLPTPASALFVVSSGWLHADGAFAVSSLAPVLAAVCLSYFMVSPMRMFALKFKDFGWKGNRLRYVFAGVSIASLVVFRVYAVPFIIMAYILVSLVSGLVCRKPAT